MLFLVRYSWLWFNIVQQLTVHSHSLRGAHLLLWRVVVFTSKHFFWALICSTADYVHILSVMHFLCSGVCLYLFRTFLLCICKFLMYQVQFTTLWAELLCIKGVFACTGSSFWENGVLFAVRWFSKQFTLLKQALICIVTLMDCPIPNPWREGVVSTIQ